MSLIKKTVFKNGIKLLTEEMPGSESSSIGIWVNSGSRNETRKQGGISHFIEHMLFKGTKTRSALDISKEIESVGGILNAFTSREYTCFYVKVLNRDMGAATALLSDIFINSMFDAVEINKEKMVVLQEIKLVEDTPDDLIHDLFAERFWQGNPLGGSVLGTAATVKSFDRAGILDYYQRHYRSGPVFITVAGGIAHGRAARLLNGAFGKLKVSVDGAPPEGVQPLERPVAFPGSTIVRKELEQAHLCMGVPVPAQAHKDRYKIYLLNTILGGGMSSRLFQEIREKRGLAYSVYSYLNLCKDTGALTVYAGTSKESFAATVRLVMKEFAKLRKGVTSDELKNAKSQLKGSMLLGLEASDNRMTKLARDEIYFGHVVPIKEITAGIDRVTIRDITPLAGALFDPRNVTLVAMGDVRSNALPKGLRG
ncbi:MAG: insulinase family protein [Deltaproteobacteria bacterium]|nr:insulinase family protein [Deltaproteobacteria bacterium]